MKRLENSLGSTDTKKGMEMKPKKENLYMCEQENERKKCGRNV
jgi:hypothetical protein